MEGRSIEIGLDHLADRMITQINYRFIYKEHNHSMYGIESIRDSLDCLLTFPGHNSSSLLYITNKYTSRYGAKQAGFILNDVYDNEGWTYGQLLVATDDEGVIEKYLALLEKLITENISSKAVLDILRLTDDKGYIFGRRGNASHKLNYLKLLCGLKNKACPSQPDITDIQVLLETPDKEGKMFWHDAIPFLQMKQKNTMKEQYCALVYFAMTNQLLSDATYSLLAKYEEVIADYILHSLTGEEKIKALTEVSFSDQPLGRYFRFKQGDRETQTLRNFRIALHEIQPFVDELNEYELPEKRTKAAWWGFFPGRKAKEEYIPLQTFSHANIKEGGPSKSR